jgi:hypothetical protein
VGKGDNQVAQAIGITAFSLDEMEMLLPYYTARLTFYALHFHTKDNRSDTYRDGLDIPLHHTGFHDMTASATRTTQFVGTGLDIQNNTTIFVADAGAFLLSDTEGMI